MGKGRDRAIFEDAAIFPATSGFVNRSDLRQTIETQPEKVIEMNTD
ncbi:hypothetical protein [Oxynema aestuarii]|jgi:hypothetical protein|uniref:Uncharacterized protein n=1 Tax=Oxynema aestuarii AP17 TaxID=2064643 RepID=A0A6H1U2G4_9CYAN|nr:hypothetical protein [Oxynema aestuarii]QIZ73068.1 hypothetical protein HCG48_22720 [Oxynema aestuarii AP17]